MIKIFNNLLNKKTLFFIVLIIIVFYRSPYIFLEGRFQAEEGYIWYRNVFLNGPLDTLFFVSGFSGYINLWMNLAAFFSSFVSILNAPLITVYFAFILLVYIFIYILNSNSDLFPNNNYKYLGCMIVLFSPVMTAEVWMNSLNAMSYLGILTFLILFEKNNSKFRILNYFFIFISGLSGYYASALVPLFLLKFLKFKNQQNFTQFLIILLSSTVQFFTTFYFKLTQEIASERFFMTYEKLQNYLYNVVLKSMFGREISQKLISLINFELLILILLITAFLLFITLIRIIINKKDHVLNFILISFLIQSFLILFGSAYKDFVGGRYAVCAGVILSFVIMRLFYLNKDNYLKYLFGILMFIFLSSGFLEYKLLNQYPQFLACIDCPNWENEISQWNNNKNYKIKIWSYPNNVMQLY